MKVLKFNKFHFIKEHMINENSEFFFNQFDLGPASMGAFAGAGYGWAVDPSVSIFSQQDSPYVDAYGRSSGLVAQLNRIQKSIWSQQDFSYTKADKFVEDINLFDNLKILRLNENYQNSIDVFISFEYDEREFFGVYKNFNGLDKPKLISDFTTDPECMSFLTPEYFLKMSNYFYKVLDNWFKPQKGFYTNLKADNPVKDQFGSIVKLKKGILVEVIGYNVDKDDDYYVHLKIKDNDYYIYKNDYFWFKYRFEIF
jgi:hypothetical protein